MDIRLIFLNWHIIVNRGGGTQEDRHAAEWMAVKMCRQDRQGNPFIRKKLRHRVGHSTERKVLIPHCQENLRA